MTGEISLTGKVLPIGGWVFNKRIEGKIISGEKRGFIWSIVAFNE